LREKLDLKLAGGDCEDFSKDIQYCHSSLIARKESAYDQYDPMLELINMAKHYICFIVDCTIYNGPPLNNPPCSDAIASDAQNGINLHMCVQLMPIAMVDRLTQVGGLALERIVPDNPYASSRTVNWPLLQVESTEPCFADWSREHASLDTFTKQIGSIRGPKSGPVNASWCKFRVHTVQQGYKRDQFYRLTVAMYSKQLYDRYGRHSWVVCSVDDSKDSNKDRYTIGVPSEDWIQQPRARNKFALRPLPSATPDEVSVLRRLQHRAINPMKIDVDESVKRIDYVDPASPDVIYMFARAFEWTANDDALFREAIAKHGGYRILNKERQEFQVTRGKMSVLYQLKPI
jgi:hypothetical protein